MSTRIRGNASFTCNACHKKQDLEGVDFTFVADTSSVDDYEGEGGIHYLAEIKLNCASCQQPISIHFDVWEFPVAAVNYCYHSEQGANNIQCEFAIGYHHQEGLDEDEVEDSPLVEDDEEESDDYEGDTDYPGDVINFQDGLLDDFEETDLK